MPTTKAGSIQSFENALQIHFMELELQVRKEKLIQIFSLNFKNKNKSNILKNSNFLFAFFTLHVSVHKTFS